MGNIQLYMGMVFDWILLWLGTKKIKQTHVCFEENILHQIKMDIIKEIKYLIQIKQHNVVFIGNFVPTSFDSWAGCIWDFVLEKRHIVSNYVVKSSINNKMSMHSI